MYLRDRLGIITDKKHESYVKHNLVDNVCSSYLLLKKYQTNTPTRKGRSISNARNRTNFKLS